MKTISEVCAGCLFFSEEGYVKNENKYLCWINYLYREETDEVSLNCYRFMEHVVMGQGDGPDGRT